MRDITFTTFDTAHDTTSKPITAPWSEWIKLFSSHALRGHAGMTNDEDALNTSKNGPAIVLGEIPSGERRLKVNVIAVHALGMDFDSATKEQLDKVFEKLAPFEHIVWTTHKHGSEVAGDKPRLRVLLPLVTPVNPEDYPQVWQNANTLANGHVDPSTKDIGRLHFYPSTFDASKARIHHNPGRWISPADLPQSHADSATSTTDTYHATSDELRRAATKAREGDLTPFLRNMGIGESFAKPGERHTAVVRLTMWLAGKQSNLTRSEVISVFSPSLSKMRTSPTDEPTDDEIFTAYEGAVTKRDEARRHKSREDKERALIIQAQEDGGPYTDTELERIAQANGWTPADLHDRWIVQRGGACWFLTTAGTYAGPYTRDDLPLAVTRYLTRAPARIIELTKNGTRYRAASDIIREVGSLADTVVSDMTLERTVFEPKTRTVREAICPLRTDVKPKFNELFDKWMQITAGPLYPKLVDWVACVPDLNKLLCAIYFDGAASSGKTLFAHGMAKLWTEGPPADIESALVSDFNDELTRCPFVLADEEMPKTRSRSITATLRTLLSTTSRTYKRKYLPTSDVRGAVRLVLAANNEFLLDTKDVSSSQDLEAVAQRFLYIPVPQAATDYLNSLTRGQKLALMESGIAEHTLWLAKNHEITLPGKRFWVEGDVSQMHRLLLTGSRWNSLICEWLVRYLIKPTLFDSRATGLIRRHEGELLVNDQAITDGWELYLRTKLDPETAKIGTALRTISATAERKQLRWEGRERIRYRVIDVDHLISWADRHNVGDAETIRKAVLEPLKNTKMDEVNARRAGQASPAPQSTMFK